MNRLKALFASASLLVGLLAGVPGAQAAVDTIYVGDAAHVSGGSCLDPDFSSFGGFEPAMEAALAAIDADGDTLVICNGDYTVSSVIDYDQAYAFTVRAETRRAVTIGGSAAFMFGCAPTLTVRGLRFHDMEEGFSCDGAMNLNLEDIEFSYGGTLAWMLGGEGFTSGIVQISDSHIRRNSSEVVVLALSIKIDQSVIEENAAIIPFFAPAVFELTRSRMDHNLAFIATAAATCLNIDRSALTGNGRATDELIEEEGWPEEWTSGHTLLSIQFAELDECSTRVVNSSFVENVAANGGALTLVEPSPTTFVKGNTFRGNLGGLAGAVAVCSESPSRKQRALASRIGFFKVNRFRGNEAPDRRANNVWLQAGDLAGCDDFFG